MAISTGKAARKRGGNRYSIKRQNRRGRRHTYAEKVKGIRPFWKYTTVLTEVE